MSSPTLRVVVGVVFVIWVFALGICVGLGKGRTEAKRVNATIICGANQFPIDNYKIEDGFITYRVGKGKVYLSDNCHLAVQDE